IRRALAWRDQGILLAIRASCHSVLPDLWPARLAEVGVGRQKSPRASFAIPPRKFVTIFQNRSPLMELKRVVVIGPCYALNTGSRRPQVLSSGIFETGDDVGAAVASPRKIFAVFETSPHKFCMKFRRYAEAIGSHCNGGDEQ